MSQREMVTPSQHVWDLLTWERLGKLQRRALPDARTPNLLSGVPERLGRSCDTVIQGKNNSSRGTETNVHRAIAKVAGR
jgi:hypothetical protein